MCLRERARSHPEHPCLAGFAAIRLPSRLGGEVPGNGQGMTDNSGVIDNAISMVFVLRRGLDLTRPRFWSGLTQFAVEIAACRRVRVDS
jgi:hypothetical protein